MNRLQREVTSAILGLLTVNTLRDVPHWSGEKRLVCNYILNYDVSYQTQSNQAAGLCCDRSGDSDRPASIVV